MATGMDYSLVQRIIDGLGKILDTKPGSPDEGTYVTEQQLADWIKGQTFVTGYYYNGAFYSDSAHTNLITPQANVLYADLGAYGLYAWDGAAYEPYTPDLSPYATKAEVQQADANLQSQIVNINSEVDNIEALIGDEAQVENVDDTPMVVQFRLIHHANLLPNGSFGRVGARSVAWNQLVQNGNFADNSNWNYDNTRVSFSASGNIAELTMLSDVPSTGKTNWGINQIFGLPITGHKYLVYYEANTPSGVGIDFNNIPRNATVTANQWSSVVEFYTAQSNNANRFYIFPIGLTTGEKLKIRNVMVIDLTAINMASLTADQFRAKFPASYYPHDTGHIYDLNPSGFRIRGINLWDEEWEVGDISNVTGENVSTSLGIRGKNKYRIMPNTAYYFLSPVTLEVYFYDAEKKFITGDPHYVAGGTITSPSNAYYIRLRTGQSYGTVYNHDIQMCLDSLPTLIKTTYHPSEHHSVDTPQIADGHYINENCYDYVENVVENGIVKGKKHSVVGSIDLGTLDWASYAYGNERTYYALLPTKKLRTNNGLCATFSQSGYGSETQLPDKSFCFRSDSIIFFRDSAYATQQEFKSAMSGVMLYYELATETITDVEPLRSFAISDYSTVEPITPQDELVNRIDVPFSVKSVSANTLIEQITQNIADIAEEKATRAAQISALDKRVTNLELKTGDQFDVDYPSPTYGMDGVPSNVEPYAKVKALRGVGRVANNLGKAINSTNWIPYSTTYSSTSFADGIVTMSWKADVPAGENFRYGIRQGLNYKVYANHLYLISYEIYSSKNLQYVDESLIGAYLGPSSICEANKWTKIAYVVSAPANNDTRSFLIYPNYNQSFVQGDYYRVRNCILTDLSVYFSSLDLSWIGSTYAERIATIQQKYPELLEPSDYGTQVVFPTYSAVRAWARNLFNPQGATAGVSLSSSGGTYADAIHSTSDYLPIRSAVQYYHKNTLASGSYVVLCYYDANKTFISAVATTNTTTTSPANAKYIRISYLTADVGQICFNISDSQNGTYTPWHEPNTLTIPNPIPLRSAGSVADTDELNVEVDGVEKRRQTQRIGQYTFTSAETWSDRGTNQAGSPVYSINVETFVPYKLSAATSLLFSLGLCLGSVASASSVLGNSDTKGFYYYYNELVPNERLFYAVGFTTAELATLQVNYELASEVVTLLDPILDNFVKVEPNGTIRTVQSQSPEVDSAMTVEYMAS